MSSQAPQRRLAAILAADMVGYSRLIERDEAGTVARLKADREEFIDPTIAAHGGRIVRLAGDGALVEFASVVEATQCAIDIQRGMLKRNAGRGEVAPIVFRIGVNLGDIIVENDNLHGEGINIAARLESLADPGGILVSEEVARHVEGKIDAPLEFVEERTVKNIERSVRIWRILLKPGTSSELKASPAPPRRLRRRWISAPLGLALALTIGGLVWYQTWTPDGEQAPEEGVTLSLPDRPSIAVLPFSNMSGDPEQEYFSDGITEDLTTDLSKISGLFVVARNSSFAYKGTSSDVREVSRDLGVKFDAAIEAALRTIEVHPTYADGHASLAFILSYSGQLDRALEAIRGARKVDPQGTGVYLAVEGRVLFLLGRYQEALVVLEESIERNPGFDRTQLHLAAVYAQLDRVEDAAWAVDEALAISPDITLDKERRESIYKEESDLAHYLGALRKAGVPE